MEPFTYTDIFDTKGIEYLIIIAFLLLVIPFWRALNKPLKPKLNLEEAKGILSANILKIPKGLYYCKNHTWTFLERSGFAKVGLDDLLVHLTGKLNLDEVRASGTGIKKGEILATFSQNGKKLQIESPLTGEIQSINSEVLKEPLYLNTDPYTKGWLVSIKPEKWKEETRSFYAADNAVDWINKEMIRFKDFISQTDKKNISVSPSVILQDGGELKAYPLSEMNEDIWKEFEKSFLGNRDN